MRLLRIEGLGGKGGRDVGSGKRRFVRSVPVTFFEMTKLKDCRVRAASFPTSRANSAPDMGHADLLQVEIEKYFLRRLNR